LGQHKIQQYDRRPLARARGGAIGAVRAHGEELISTDNGAAPHDLESTLTAREREVIRLVAQGANSRQIAAELYLFPLTVRRHVRNAMVKTRAHTRAQLVAIVLGDGFID
jgi:DNA-binding NarL/FixJ family response regulator